MLVSGHCHVRGRTSGAESDPDFTWVIGVRDGKIVSHRVCQSYEEAIDAARANDAI